MTNAISRVASVIVAGSLMLGAIGCSTARPLVSSDVRVADFDRVNDDDDLDRVDAETR